MSLHAVGLGLHNPPMRIEGNHDFSGLLLWNIFRLSVSGFHRRQSGGAVGKNAPQRAIREGFFLHQYNGF